MDSSGSIKNLRSVLGHGALAQDDLSQYERYLRLIETNRTIEPNLAFEATKALAEAIFRHILAHKRIKLEFAEVITQGDLSTYKLFRAVCRALADHDLIDIEIFGFGGRFFNDMAEVRNSMGIISHGKDLRKVSNLKISTLDLSISNTVSYIAVILEAYEKLLGEPELDYEDNPDFNDLLDSEREIEGIVYSRALYEQDIVAYKEQLDAYNETKEDN